MTSQSSLSEKDAVTHLEQESLKPFIDPKVEARLVTKLDIWLMPLFTLLFFLNFLDRAAVGNSNAAGLSKDLNLSGPKYEYNIALIVFYIFYIVIEPLSNLALKRFGGRWLSFLVISFGLVTIGSAFVQNFNQFLAVRCLLGAAEGGVIPGIALILSRFYRRHELVLRIGIFLAMGPSLSGAFGGLLAGGLLGTGDIGSVTSWRKIFLVEGMITTFVGIISLAIISTSPETATWLTADEKFIATNRISIESVAVTGEKATPALIKRSFKNLFMAIMCFGYGLINIPVQGTSLFLPTIIKGLGNYGSVETQLRSAPPYIFACFYTIFVSYMCYRTRRHGIFICMSLLPSTIGYIIFITCTDAKVLYFASFLTYSGAVPCGPIYLAWATANSSPETSRAITAAMVPAIGSYGSIIATWAYLPAYAPRYLPGNALNIGATVLSSLIAIIAMSYIKWENKQRDEGKRDHRLVGLSDKEVRELGYRHPSFRYLI